MAETTITTTYREIEITYEEYTNEWHFTIRGRERVAASVKEAKEAIDKPAPKKAKPFQRFEAWLREYNGDAMSTVTVMSIVDIQSRWKNESQVRVKDSEGDLKQASVSTVFPKGAKNDELVGQIIAVVAEIDALEKKKATLMEKLTPYKIEPE